MNVGHYYLRKALVTLLVLALAYAFSSVLVLRVPTIWRTFFLPSAVLILAVTLMPPHASAGIRLAVTAIVLILVFLTTRLQPGPYFRTELIVVAFLWGIAQVVLAIASERVRIEAAGPLLASLREVGYIATLRRMTDGRFGNLVARGTRAARWAIAILLASLLLSRADALDSEEENLVLFPHFRPSWTATSQSVVVT
ncbi:MAG TPA: hypothetical protein VLT13_14935, partial [Bacteroidota bacterium]|nr:hypothetical protein [Bacteroidota bacterium]